LQVVIGREAVQVKGQVFKPRDTHLALGSPSRVMLRALWAS